jgi:hypothetical protein
MTILKIFLLAMLIMVAAVPVSCFSQGNITTSNSPANNSLTSSPVDGKTVPTNSVEVSPSAITPSSGTPGAYFPVLRAAIISDPVISQLPVDEYPYRTISDHNYFYPANPSLALIKTEVNYNNRPPLQVRYISKQNINQYTTSPYKISYDFETIDAHAPVSLWVSSENNTGIGFTPGMTYRIINESMPPVGNGIVICQGSEIVYANIMDFGFDGCIGIDNCFWPLAVPTFNVKQRRLLKDNYREINNDIEYIIKTNLEIEFLFGEKSFVLHQGQSATLGDYKIDLFLADAIHTQFKRDVVVDGVTNGFSFSFCRLIESIPSSVQSPGDEKATFVDSSLLTIIRNLMKINDRDLTRMDLVGLYHLDASNKSLNKLNGLENCGSLFLLDLKKNHIQELSPISNLSGLNFLFLDNNEISDLRSLSPANLKALSRLSLNSNQISDITLLAQSHALYQLELSNNKIVDISPLSNLSELSNLNLSYNRISDISGLASLKMMYTLNLAFNKITDISVLSNVPFFDLDLRGNSISDLSPLVENPNLVRRSKIKLGGNPLSDKSISQYIPELKKREIEVEYFPVSVLTTAR